MAWRLQRAKMNGIRYVFVQNFNRNAVEIKLPVEQYPVWNGQYDGTIGSWETVVLKENSPNFREKVENKIVSNKRLVLRQFFFAKNHLLLDFFSILTM